MKPTYLLIVIAFLITFLVALALFRGIDGIATAAGISGLSAMGGFIFKAAVDKGGK